MSAPASKPAKVTQDRSDDGSFRHVWHELARNRLGMIGFGLSLLQVMVHGSWLVFIVLLTYSGAAAQLQANDWRMWVIAVLMIAGAALTAVSLFLCLYAAIHGTPKVLALTGLCISFFVGALTTFVLLFNALATGAADA